MVVWIHNGLCFVCEHLLDSKYVAAVGRCYVKLYSFKVWDFSLTKILSVMGIAEIHRSLCKRLILHD